MPELLAQLVREVERVVTAPYAPSLQDLNELVHQRRQSTISSWAISKPCQVGLLADVLVEALSRSRVALPLITVFASASAFRDALLERNPVLLDAFLEKAVRDEGVEYSSACIALLSSPLPAGVVPPARIAPFITKLVDTMAGKPCIETIAPIHALISGIRGSPRILDDIPSDIMSNLQLEFTKILRNLDDHMGNLLCLATFAQIATALDTTSQNQHGSESPTWLLNIKHFFGQKRGLKTLDLVVLRVILACSSSCNLAPSEAAESIRLAICIADATGPEQKRAWIAGNSSKIAKLCEKAAREGLEGVTRTMVIIFLHTLLPSHSLSSQLRDLGMDVLLSKDSHGTIGVIPPTLVSRLAKSLAELGESTARRLLIFTLDALKGSKWPAAGTMEMLHLADLVLAGLHQTTILTSANTLVTPLGEVLGEMVEYFLREPSESQCSGQTMCTSQLYSMRNRLFLSLFGLYDMIFSAHDGKIMKSFLARVARSVLKADCAFSRTSTKDFRGFFTLRDGRDPSNPINRDWRSGVTELFVKNAQTSQETMMRKIEDTCFDLERRCNDVEGPLRAAEAERDRYAHDNEELKRQNEELKTQVRQSSESFTELGYENTRLEQLLQEHVVYREELTSSLGSVQEKLWELQQSSEQAILTEKEKSRSKELEIIAILTEKEDQLEELHEKICGLQTRNEEARQALDQLTSEKATLSDLSTSLKQELVDTVNTLEQAKLRADQTEDGMRTELESLKSRVAEQNSELERLSSALHKADGLRSDIESLNTNLQAEATRAMSEIAKHETEKCRLQTALKAVFLEASKAAELKEKRIQHLERKVQALRDERASKAREFSEAQQHIGRLMGVMGFSANAPGTNEPKHQRTRSSMHPTTPAARVPQPISDDEDGTKLTESFESMASNLNEPTPKRPRSNSKPTNESGVPVNSFAAGLGPKTRSPPPTSRVSRSMRMPLSEADPNSLTKSQSRSVSKRSQVDELSQEPQAGRKYEENRLQDLNLDMDLEFSRDFLFTSTDFTRSGDQIDQ
ncbi:uncharacterized protein N7515_008025 [Penicillium bovifimosum]|uniref:Uncharacterized protein n=1 Tax=Penicillium bovifimosum TaxID=126998 RepID=A0A9W9GNQ9_9EURO|nr:uncharacterized protein N7515_008025 [Penicillium bovifimosum]KAJ5124200.1 hypothetical protein N7515_008025 [Penicillium bovifimosum]